jgi:hypothetical protein
MVKRVQRNAFGGQTITGNDDVINGWRPALDELRKRRDHAIKDWDLKTSYEKKSASDALQEYQVSVQDLIVTGGLQEFDGQRTRVMAALGKVREARQAEINSWNPETLAAEIKLSSVQLEGIATKALNDGAYDLAAGVQRLAAASRLSGDRYKQRGIASALAVMPLSTEIHMDRRLPVNRIMVEAEEQINAVREKEIQPAHDFAAEAVVGLNIAKSNLADIDQVIGATRPNGEIGNYDIYNALATVKQDDQGRFHFSPEDDFQAPVVGAPDPVEMEDTTPTRRERLLAPR